MKTQATIKTCLTATMLLSLLLLTSAFVPASAAQDSNGKFSIIWVTDTQYLSESQPAYYNSLCQWIVQNRDVYNVKMVIHTGDLVEDEGNRTQWQNANQSMGILLDSGVPYTWDAGNHDFNSTLWIGNQYSAFNPQVMQNKPYWVSDDFDGMSTAVSFNASGWQWLIVNVAFQANDSVLAWANNLLDSHPQAHAIVATHAYLNRLGEYETWATHFKGAVLDTHANVFLTLNGHYYPTDGVRTRVGGRDELLFNQQDAYDDMGAASARILTFDTNKGTMTVQTYSLYLNQFINDSNNSFILNTSFRNDAAGQSQSFPVLFATVVVVVCLVFCLLLIVRWRKKRAV